ncbi:DHA2 family efflux MFS transporter permease subunit [Pseudonocardia eucalypti]|uniref:DHA2 family efflux MFS transporter permease subunit n=1 Tax=Pseudonocardia eucalypti TaxID=648755 RepID=A0ABP9QX90_9PSEU
MLITGMFMSILDVSIVNVAIPTIQKQFAASTQDIQWITTAYTLCLGMVVPGTAWLGDRFGLTRTYLVSLLSFAAASALCALAWDLPSMVAFRILQAIPGGIIPVVCVTMLYRIVPSERIGTAMGLYGLGIVVAPAIGPTLGGYLVDYVDWRLIFLLNLPIGLVGCVAAAAVLPRFGPGPRRRFDLPGFAAAASGLFALLLAVSEGQDWGWTGYRVLGLTVFGLLALALFVVLELEVEQPLLDLRVFRHWPFVNSLLLITANSVALFSPLFYLPLFLQEGRGMQAFDTGLLLLPPALVMLVMMPIAGRLYDLIGPRIPTVLGLVVTGYGMVLMADISADITRQEVVVWTMVRSLGVGLCMMPIMTGGISALPPEIVSSGSAVNTIVQRVATAFGLAALTALATTVQAQTLADRAALLDPGADPRLHELAARGASALYPLMRELQLQTMATSFHDVFLVIAWMSFAAAGLALLQRHGRPARAGTAEPAEIG